MYNKYMEYTYSKHFLLRMQERDINFEDIEQILLEKVDTVQIPSKTDQNVFLLLGFVKGKGIAIILNSENLNLITVRRMRKNEEKLF